MLALNILSGAAGTPESWTSLGNGWDKASDVNVQVFGHVPDAGNTLLLLGSALTGLAMLKRRYQV